MFVKLFIEAVFPSKCLSCGNFFNIPITRFSHDAASEEIISSVLCLECRKDIVPASPFPSGEIFAKAHAAGAYQGALRTLIHAFKYKDKTRLAQPFGMLLFSTFISYWNIKEIDMITPVPLHISRMRKRGFNQALLMLGNWHKMFKMINAAPIPVEPELLIRVRATTPQVELDRIKRKTNLRNAFRVRCPETIRGKTVLLVDDVYTTGTTVSECAKVLLDNGAGQVHVLTLAKA